MENEMKDILISALKKGGRILLDYFGKPVTALQKESMSSVVTEADLNSDQAIVSFISEKYPKHNIISEEGGFRNKRSEYTWVIDPLDGTSNFAANIPWFGVLITLFEQNIPVLGGAYLPYYDILYFAGKGKGAFRNDEPLNTIFPKELKDSLIAFSIDFTEDDAFLTRGITLLKYIIKNSRNIRSTNSLMDFIYVAEGKFGGCINMFTKIWDISGLGLIISETGGTMVDLSGNEIRYSIDKDIMYRNFPVITGSKEIVDTLFRAIN